MFSHIKLPFTKINETRYSVVVPVEIRDYVNEVITNIGNGLNEKFDIYLTRTIEDQLYSRILSSLFFKNHKELLPEVRFCVIEGRLGERTVNVSLGMLDVDENTTVNVNGVLYS